MNLGVLLLYCNDNPRVTTFTRNWAEAAVKTVADYFYVQSGGRESITFKVFEWAQLTMPSTQWGALGMGAGPAVRADYINPSSDQYTHVLIGIDVPGASDGTTPLPLPYTYLAAQDFLPTSICHELGHVFGAPDAWGETASGAVRYLNHWCVMGGTRFPYSFPIASLSDPAASPAGLDVGGPSMAAPSLLATGWANPQQPGVTEDLTDSTSVFMAGGVATQLSALTGAPGPGWARPPLVIRYDDLLVEYRVRAPDGWDRAIPDPGPDAAGWIVVHRSTIGDPPTATFVKAMKAAPGNTLVLGEDNPLDIFHDGPLVLTVLIADAANDTVRLTFSRRAAQPLPQHTGTGSRGASSYAGVIIWTHAMGTTIVARHSPLLPILTTLTTVSALHSAQLVATSEEADGLAQRTAQMIEELHEQVARLPATPKRSPLAEALERVTELRAASERYSNIDGDVAREFVDLSRDQLAGVERALADAVEAEAGG